MEEHRTIFKEFLPCKVHHPGVMLPLVRKHYGRVFFSMISSTDVFVLCGRKAPTNAMYHSGEVVTGTIVFSLLPVLLK